ncbi:electron transfer flavoprotein subunit alpha/FixB family protein [Oceanobacter mangrovi]|uniref:electron transfer flavoprotein subunit alpha/FixB family protein n=1 Tax=Oceanobacter mangrovi TaxID=2862510 RepID=UPI001C8DFFA4|nr:electron transfer flavoprotein subunit alpha/FixB family protein [Oceanobacter mangrovi]
MSDVIRKDPRKNWILRNRLHPLHEQVVAEMNGPAAVVRGPSGLIRKNPHAVGFIGPNGIKRIDRLGGSGSAAASAKREQQEEQLPIIAIEQPQSYVVVVVDAANGELSAHDRDVLGQARLLADGRAENTAVVALVFGALKAALGEAANPDHAFGLAGADRVMLFDDECYAGFAPEQQLEAMLAVDRQLSPVNWLFPDTHLSGNDRALRLAARLGERPAMHAWQIKDGKVTSRGGSEMTDITRDLAAATAPRILALASECALPVDEARYEARLLPLPSVPNAMVRIKDAGAVAVDPNQIAMGEAEFILSAGNGIHDWDQFHATAAALGATEGASRVAVDNGFMPRFRQVGATGTWVTARVYIAVGISGAVQHLQGIGSCEKVIAINTDAGCDMVKRADLSVIGDSQEILAALKARAEQGAVAVSEPQQGKADGESNHNVA